MIWEKAWFPSVFVYALLFVFFFASSLYLSSLSNRPELGERVVLRSTRLLLLCGNARCELLCVHLTPFWCSSHSVGFSPEFMYICIRIFVLLDLTWSKKKNIYKQKVIQNVSSYSLSFALELLCTWSVGKYTHYKTRHSPTDTHISAWIPWICFRCCTILKRKKSTINNAQQRQNSNNNNNDRRMMSIIEQCTARTRWHWTHLINLLTKWNAYNHCWIWATLTCRWD